MRSLIFRILNKLYPLRDMDADLDMNKFHIVGDYTNNLPFVARLNLRVIKCRAILLSYNGNYYIHTTNKNIKAGDYIVLGMCEVKKLDSPVGIEEKL